jgi:hypothetical protein
MKTLFIYVPLMDKLLRPLLALSLVIFFRVLGKMKRIQLNRSCHIQSTLVIIIFTHFHETEHAIIDKMVTDSTDHEIFTRLRKKHDFNTIL